MKNLKTVLAMVDKFEAMISKAQLTSAQPGDVEHALKAANLFDVSAKVSPLLNAAKVPDSATVQIDIVVDKNLNPNYSVTLNPPSPSANTLASLVKRQFAAPMKKALTDAKLSVADTVETKWLSF